MTPPERLQDVTLAERLLGVQFIDALAQEIRRVDGSHSMGAGALAEAIAPFIEREAAAALSGWLPIESAPKGEALLFHPATKSRAPLQRIMRVGWAGDWPNRPATHWMPLPEPPTTPPSEG